MKTQYPLLKLNGRSGCKLEVLNREGVFYVKKVSKDGSYNSRLLLQAEKQQQYFVNGLSPHFKTPRVLCQSSVTDTLTSFEMPYLHAQKYSEYFERATIQQIKELTGKFSRYFMDGFEKSKIVEVDNSLFLEKLSAVESSLTGRLDVNPKTFQQTLKYLEEIPGLSIPMHQCHGDFTFSNMLFCDDGIYLVDFLDSFLESPLIDLVKFRQDTFFYWSLLIENQLPKSRSAKIIQIFNYLDAHVYENLANNKFVKVWYKYLQVFNLFRILPYVSRKEEINFVQTSIHRLI